MNTNKTSSNKVTIAYWRYFDFDGKTKFIGGIETYLRLLAECCTELGFEVTLYQCANKHFIQTDGALKIIGVPVTSPVFSNKTRVELLKAVFSELADNDILVYGSEIWSTVSHHRKSILIQHGISWDRPITFLSQHPLAHRYELIEKIKRAIIRREYLKLFDNTQYKVCVDYNFINWYRTFRTVDDHRMIRVIINPTPLIAPDRIENKLSSPKKGCKILFARRFEPFRGSRFMIDLANQLLHQRNDIEVTFAGDGLDTDLICNTFRENRRVVVMKVPYENRMECYFNHDISIIPSYGSEGTSLTVAESMAAGCAVLASDAGGMTNMIIDGFNGFMAWPDIESYVNRIESLVENRDLWVRVVKNGYNLATQSFNINKWKSAWADLLLEISQK